MDPPGTTLRTSIDVADQPPAAFQGLVDELVWALDNHGIQFEAGPDGLIVQGEVDVGRVVAWEPGERILLEWRPTSWEPTATTEVGLRFESHNGGTRIDLIHRHWGQDLEESADVVGWFATEAVAAHFLATAPDSYGAWLTERKASKPTGGAARAGYADPLYHYPNFRAILAELALEPDDFLLEVGCGGGALLSRALESGCRAAAVDHSPEMVRLARDANRDTIDAGRLVVRKADAASLPFEDRTFTAATMTGVLGHLPEPVAVLREMHRVLDEDGRIVILGSDPELQGTPAAPEPMASRMQFYETEELVDLARDAGFEDERIERHNLESHARAVGIPEEHLSLFDFPSRFLLARTRGSS